MVEMNNVAFVFPGQGAQYIGMGRDFYENFLEARTVFEKANHILNFNLTRLCFKGSEEELKKTLNSQIAIFTVSIACYEVVKKEFDFCPMIVGGLSLGEYTALVVAQSISFEEGLILVKKRAEFMEESCRERLGGMVSIIGLSLEEVEEICRQEKGEVANLNSPGQIVVSSGLEKIEAITDLVKQKKGKAIVLKTNGGFHSSLMNSAAEKLKRELKKREILPAKIPIVSNFSADLKTSPGAIKKNLANQINQCTRWQDCVRLMINKGVNTFLEIGPGKVLTRLLPRIDSSVKGYSVEDMKSLEKLKRE